MAVEEAEQREDERGQFILFDRGTGFGHLTYRGKNAPTRRQHG
jgi:hypothetical protein